ncbi:hypothetical protein [Calidifontibacter terrae]
MRDRRIIPLLVIAVGVLLIAVALGQRLLHDSTHDRGMTDGTVTARTTSGTDLSLTVRYAVDGKTHQVTGTVDKAQYDWQGGAIWVCYAAKDPAKATLRLPYDPWCNQK